MLSGGLGSSVLELLTAKGLKTKTHCIDIPDNFVEHGTPKQLRELYGLTPDGLVKEINLLLGYRKSNTLKIAD